MSRSKQLPSRVKSEIQRSSALIVLANLILMAVIGVFFSSAFSTALLGSWGTALAQCAAGTLFLWLFLPHIALNCIELYVNSTRLEHNYAKLDAIVTTTLRMFRLLRMQKSVAVSSLLLRLGQTKIAQGDFENAEQLFKESITCTSGVPSARRSVAMAMSILNLASAYAWQERFLESEIEAEKALSMLQKSSYLGVEKFKPYCLLLMGINRYRLGEIESAEETLLSAFESFEEMKPSLEMPLLSIQSARISCYLYLAALKVRKGNIQNSYEYFNKFFDLVQGSTAIMTTTHIRSINTLVDEYLRIGDFQHAEDLINIAYELSGSTPFHPDTQHTITAFEKLLIATERQPEIADMKSWLRPIPQIANLLKD